MDDTDEGAALIEQIEGKLESIGQMTPEDHVRALVAEAMRDIHERFTAIERAVGIVR